MVLRTYGLYQRNRLVLVVTTTVALIASGLTTVSI